MGYTGGFVRVTALPSAQLSNSHSNSQQWLLILLATACGFTAAWNIGKVPPSVPALRAEFATSLTWTAALVSSYSVVAMTCSLAMGRVVGWLGVWRTTALGLLFLFFGGLLGVVTPLFPVLLVGRIVEGLGYLAIAVTMPAFVARVCSESNRALAMGVWGTFVPGGITLCLLAAPMLTAIGGWRSLWWAGVGGAAVMLVIATVFMRPVALSFGAGQEQENISWRVVINRTSVLMALSFVFYSMAFTGLATFLPTYWSEVSGLSLSTATQFTAVVVATNILGNLSGGWFNKLGISFRTLLAVGVALSAVCGMVVYTAVLPFGLQLMAAILFSFLGGVAPATMFATVGRVTVTPAQSGLLVGLLFQGAGAGQVIGPLVLGAMIDSFGGWFIAPVFFMICMLLGALVVSLLPATPTKFASAHV